MSIGHSELSLGSVFCLDYRASRLKELVRKMLRKDGENSVGARRGWLEFFADEQSGRG